MKGNSSVLYNKGENNSCKIDLIDPISDLVNWLLYLMYSSFFSLYIWIYSSIKSVTLFSKSFLISGVSIFGIDFNISINLG